MMLFPGLLSLALASIVNALVLPSDLSELTGLSDSQLKQLLYIDAPSFSLEARATNCSSNDTAGGVFPGPTVPTTNDLLKRNAFVTREGTKLQLLGEDFRIVGSNIYWLGLDENVIPDPSYPSRTRVLEAFADVSVMRGTAVRGHTLGISVGNPLSVEPSLDVFNEDAYDSIDFAILAARFIRNQGSCLLIPLVDNYNYYHGGKYQFIGWNGIAFNGTGDDITPPDVGAFFYNTTTIVDSFKRYITQHLNHVNQYTGIALKDDPTILGWESGNELSGALFAPKQLFMDGSYGIFPETGQLANENVDILDFFWSLFGHDDECCQYVEHDDGESFYYLRADPPSNLYIDRGNILIEHAGQISGAEGDLKLKFASRQSHKLLPAVACPQYRFPESLLPPGFHV
ncbi:glycoside hydrolase [Phellopilus nigrolimitatus]|nr:glycoside hydrolase [Phellopilus nigrolimitatus]